MANLPAHLAHLLQPAAYPHPVTAVTLVETHISWILLTGEFAYKIKRPVHLPFLDLSTLERRLHFCREELRLNRRFAAGIYLEVCGITLANGTARIDGPGDAIEYAVKMRQFRREDELDNLLRAGRIDPQELRDFGRELARLHDGLPVAGAPATWGDPLAIRTGLLKNLEECAEASAVFHATAEVRALLPELVRRFEAARPCMEDRRQHWRVRECHGDLHAANIVRLESKLVAFDCLEFEPAFRWIDVAEEVAFLHVDLEARGYPLHAHAFLDGYLARGGDYEGCRLLPLYRVHRALVRAKVIALTRARESDRMPGEAIDPATDDARRLYRAYLECASRSLSTASALLVLTSGLSGSGKTWLAQRLAPEIQAIHVRSDVERKRMAGLDELQRTESPPSGGIYSAAFNAMSYKRLAEVAAAVLAGGYNVIVDATFARRDDRNLFHTLARDARVRSVLIHCHAPRAVLVRRIGERLARGSDASEADAHVLDWQQRHWEPIDAAESWHVEDVQTDSVGIPDLVRRLTASREP